MFGLEKRLELPNKPPPFLKEQDICLVNARSGIALLVELLSPSNIWLPSYLCSSMLQAVEKYPATVKFYEVDYDLIISSCDWLDQIRAGDLAVFIDYFGFSADPRYAIEAKKQGAFVLDDASQALLSKDIGRQADLILFSPRKFLGVPDGGILSFVHDIDLELKELSVPPEEWWLNAFFATIERREFDLNGGSRNWFKRFQQANNTSPIGQYHMSNLSRYLLMYAFDYETIAQKRVENYKLLAEILRRDIALFEALTPDTIPLGFPIRVKNRDRIRQELFSHQIYPPVHWPIQEFVPLRFQESHRLASEILTLPCDQRYDKDDMERMAQIVLKSLQ